METYFAPAKRTDRRKFENQIYDVSHSPIMDVLLKTMSGLIVVLNQDRQIVTLNHAFLEAIGITDAEKVLGLRLGETLHCIHANEKPNGCGTTPFCITCGAAIATMSAIKDDKSDEKICALSSQVDGVKHDISMLIRAQPITIDKNRWILIFAQDITQQQFWTNMERLFFHDMNNMLTALIGNSQLLSMEMPDNNEIKQILNASERLHTEIKIQKTLFQYKDSKYLLRKSDATTNDIKKETQLIINGHNASEGKQVEEYWPEEEIKLYTDVLIVSRILGNMIINALEATEKGETVRISTRVSPDNIMWDVWNKSSIPDDVQKRIFQKLFSTKGDAGRGLGTFSMKLFGEDHLKGKISFSSSPGKGTTFSFKLPLI